MTPEQIILIILVGAAAGWLGSYFYKGSDLGMPGNVVVGILGSFVGSWLLKELKVNLGGSSPLFNTIISGAIGAFVILLFVGPFIGRKNK